MTNMRGVGGAPRGLRTHQPSLHGRRTNELRQTITTAPTRRASSQRSTARRDSANAMIIPPTNARRATTNKKARTHTTHLQLNPNQQILKAMIRGITPSHGQARPTMEVSRLLARLHRGMLNNPGDREKIWTDSNTDTWDKGCRRHDFKGGNHR